MKKVTYRKVDSYNPSKDDLNLIKEFIQDERENVQYHESYDELMNVLEIIADEIGVSVEMTRHFWVIEHKYQKFHKSFMWHDYHTRKQMLCKILVEFIRWYNLPDRLIIDKHYKWLKEQEEKNN